METLSALLALCEQNSNDDQSLDIFLVVKLETLFNKQSIRWWFETLRRSHDLTLIIDMNYISWSPGAPNVAVSL